MKTTILLVEDSKMQRLANERILRKAGYTVLNASDGEEALRVARENIPDLILLDMLIPKLRGRDVMRALKHDPPTALIPIVILSSLPQSNERKLKKEGAAGYFAKERLVGRADDGRKELIQLIEDSVQKSRNASERQSKKSSRGEPLGPIDSLELSHRDKG